METAANVGAVLVIVLQALLVLHVLSAAIWLGAGLGTARRLRTAWQEGGALLRAAADDARKMQRWRLIGAIATVVTGLAIVLGGGGFAAQPVRIHVGLALVMVGLALELALVAPAIARVGEGDAGRRAIRRIAAGTGAVHLVWLLTLVTMLWRF
jgi:hypothetical protein